MIVMPRPALISSSIALTLIACGRPSPDDTKLRVAERAELDGASPHSRAPKRAAPPMPETFTRFPRPELAALDGVWLIEAQPPNPRLVWVVEEQGNVLTAIDRHGRETVFDVTLTSPCALRLTDEQGNAQTRSFALSDQRLIVTGKGAIAVSASDGSLLACVGFRTYQIAADGRCRYTTELLGTWSDPVEAENACELEVVDGVRVLTIAGQPLREQDGVWLDELAASGVATRLQDRAAGLAAIIPAAPAEAEPPKGETGETG
jgi:hypothetical protein